MGWKSIIFTAFLAFALSRLYLIYHEFVNMEFPDRIFFNTSQLAASNGYSAHEYNVTTHDGTSVIVFRLLGKGKKSPNTGLPILYVAGMFGNSDTSAFLGPDRNIVYVLVNEGYDVWLFNDRTSIYTSDTPTPTNYTRKGFLETGIYDMPGVVDFVSQKTGYKKIGLACTSIGAGKALVMLSERPKYNDKIKLVLFLSPGVVTYPEMSSLRWFLSLLINVARPVRYFRESRSVDFHVESRIKLVYYVVNNLFPPVIDILVEAARLELDTKEDTIHIILRGSLGPYGDTLKDIVMFDEDLNKMNKFYKVDYGREGNLIAYNSEVPPAYDLSRVTAPIKIYYAQEDDIINNKKFSELVKQIPNVLGEITTDAKGHGGIMKEGAWHKPFIADVLQTLKMVTADSTERKPPS